MNARPIGALLTILVAAAPLAAQEEGAQTQEAQEQEPQARATTQQEDAALPEILRAIQLPNVAEVLRERGVPTEEIEAAMESGRKQGVPPAEMTDILEETTETVDETGPIENFGAFVEARLAEGLRGRELAEAIRAEHARRGIGQGRMLESRGRGQGMSGGPPGRAGRSGMGPDSMMTDSMRAESGRRGPPMERGQRGQRPDSMPARGGGQGQRGKGGGQGGGQGQGGSQGQGGGQISGQSTGGPR